MPITSQPQWNPLSASRPISFTAFYTAPDPSTVKHAVIKVFLDGAIEPYKILYVAPYTTAPSLIPGFTEFLFNIDIHGVFEDLLGPQSSGLPTTFGVLNTVGIAVNNEFFTDFNISVSYQILDSTTGLLSNELENEISSVFSAFATKRQHLDIMDLEEFIGFTPTTFGRPLTNRTLQQEIGENENAFLSVISNYNYFRLFIYDLNGDPFPTPEYFGFIPGAINEQITFGIGTANLYEYTFFNSLVLPSVDLISRYEINVGVGVPVGSVMTYTPLTETYTYTIKKNCLKRELRLQWLNGLGGVDQYTFQGLKALEVETKSQKGQKGLNWGATSDSSTAHNTSDFGQYKYNIKARNFYTIETVPLDSATQTWIESLLYSSNVQAELEINGVLKYVAVDVEDISAVIDKSKGLNRLNLVINFSNEILTFNL